jgi:hypothetical protein
MEVPLYLIVLLPVVAAFASWRLAARQGRSAKLWAFWTLLLGGLPLIFLMIYDLFRLPKFGTAPRYDCCADQSWTPLADFGHAAGADFDLGRCENCGTYLMAVFYVQSTNYVVISKERAEYFLKLQGTPELKKALKNWFD